MKRKPGARELEFGEVAALQPKAGPLPLPAGEALAMLARRGFRPERSAGDAPFPQPLEAAAEEKLAGWLGHYAFRLFLRGAILKPRGFFPAETTRYLTREQSEHYAGALVDLGLAEKNVRGRYRLKWAAKNFGGTLEWYVGRELERRFGFDVATGVKLHTPGVGGDLDVVASAEGKLLYLELKSSPPKNLAVNEIAAFLDRLNTLRPELALFVIDTALRLSDKVLPMFVEELRRRGCRDVSKQRVSGELWALSPRVYLVNGSRDLMANIGKAVAAGLRALSPEPYGS